MNRLCAYIAIITIASCALHPLRAEEDQRILFLSSYSKDIPAQIDLEKGLTGYLAKYNVSYSISYEFFDSVNIDDVSAEIFKKYIQYKYKNNHFDIIIGTSVDYYLSIIKLLQFQEFGKAIVIGTTDTDSARNRVNKLREIFEKVTYDFSREFSFEYLLNQPLETIKKRLSKKEKDTIVFYLLMFSDRKNTPMTPYHAALEFTAQSKIPVYSFWESLMGSGIVGGYLLSLEKMGEYVGECIEKPDTLNDQSHHIYPMRLVYDWQAIKKWNIDYRQIDNKAVIINKPPDFFTTFKKEIIIFIAGTLFLFILIVILVRQKILTNTNKELRDMQLQLREKIFN
jgi:hypothetical protein